MGTFQSGVMQYKRAAMLTPSLEFKTIIETFQMRYSMTFDLKVHQNYHKL